MTDPRIRQLAESRNGYDAWDSLDAATRQYLTNEAEAWLRAAVAAGIAPPAAVDDCPGCAEFPPGGYRPTA